MRDVINETNAKAMMILSMAIFGTLGVCTRFIDMPASVIVFCRGFFGAAFLLMFIYFSGSRLSKRDIRNNIIPLICSGVCLGLNWLFLFEAYKTIEISVATVLNYLTPALVILVSPVFLKTKLTGMKLGCALLALFGLVLVSGILESDPAEINTYGLTCGIMAAVFYTGMVIFNKKLGTIGSYDRTFAQLLIAGAVVFVYCAFTVNVGELVFDAKVVILLLTLALVHTAIAFTLYFGSLSMMDAPSAVIYGYIEPVLGLVLSVVILHEDLGPIGWLGAALILGSTFLSETIDRRKMRHYLRKDQR